MQARLCVHQAEMIWTVTALQFGEILRLGLGRAILYARSHDVRPLRDVSLDACLHCHSYDIQVEGTRAAYMHDLVACLPDRDFYHEEVLKSLSGSGDDWDAAQRFHFAACLAFDGNEKARGRMYDSYAPGPAMGELIGIDFLKMDGIGGLLFVAEKIGALLMVKPEEVDQGYLLNQSLEICGGQSTWDALREAGITNPKIETYRLAAEEASHGGTSAPGRLPDIASLRYEQLWSELPANKPYLLSKWGERANDQDLEAAANALLAAQNSNNNWRTCASSPGGDFHWMCPGSWLWRISKRIAWDSLR
jgi:hypothetical protein